MVIIDINIFKKKCFFSISVASGIYIAQELMKSKLPFGRKVFLVAPILIGSVSAYYVTQHNTKICQYMWMAMEEKHTAITPASGMYSNILQFICHVTFKNKIPIC